MEFSRRIFEKGRKEIIEKIIRNQKEESKRKETKHNKEKQKFCSRNFIKLKMCVNKIKCPKWKNFTLPKTLHTCLGTQL